MNINIQEKSNTSQTNLKYNKARQEIHKRETELFNAMQSLRVLPFLEFDPDGVRITNFWKPPIDSYDAGIKYADDMAYIFKRLEKDGVDTRTLFKGILATVLNESPTDTADGFITGIGMRYMGQRITHNILPLVLA